MNTPTEKRIPSQSCTHCQSQPAEYAFIFEPLQTTLTYHQHDRVIHIHFGGVHREAELIHEESQWLYQCLKAIYEQYDTTSFFVAVDLSPITEYIYPRNESLRLYAELMKHTQTNTLVCYGVNNPLKFIMQMLIQMSTSHLKTVLVHTQSDVDILYTQWKAQ